MAANEIELVDLRRLTRCDSPDLAEAVVAFLRQADPVPGSQPQGAMTLFDLTAQTSRATLRWVGKRERRDKIVTAWKAWLTQTEPPLPPRFQLADLLVEVYERDSDAGRAALIELAKTAPLRYGLWAGLKRVYKLAEQRLDAEVFGVLAWRFDHAWASRSNGDVSPGTTLYLRRRAWRFLRHLGTSVPALYPQFAVHALKHYTQDLGFARAWIPNHIWAHASKRYDRVLFHLDEPQDMVEHRAFPDAWRRSPDALMDLLESCAADAAARFAIQGLRKDFPDRLRGVTPAWLARLASRPMASAHEFLIDTLQGSAELHQSKLRAVGLHEAAVSLLLSPSARARAWAIEYARAHAHDLPHERLLDLLSCPHHDTKKFALDAIQSVAPRALGQRFLGRLLDHPAISSWAVKHLSESFDRAELASPFLLDMLFGSHPQRAWVVSFLGRAWKPGELPASFWQESLDDPRAKDNYYATQVCLSELGKRPVSSLPSAWLLDALARPYGPTVGVWLSQAEALPGLDVERVKGMVFSAAFRPVALAILGNSKLARPRELGLGWLLALARRADPSLHTFAHRYLLEHMKPEDFAEDAAEAALDAGVRRLFELALGEKEPEPVRLFAQTYLRCHHPVIGPKQPESKSYRLQACLTHAAYAPARLWGSLKDFRPDVRRFAVALTRAELRAWDHQTRVYELADSEFKDVRAIAYDALLKADDPHADACCTLTVSELDATKVFTMTESLKRSTRETGMEVIRRHYDLLGGAERLAWLMESPDREVRLFSVRLLWERHRPAQHPTGWRPRAKGAPAAVVDTTRFEDVDALRAFLRRVLFGLPPGRMERRDGAAPRRHIPASEAKRNVIAVLRDMGLSDVDFARVVAPILAEFTGSLARGEWQACLAALVQLRGAHPGVELGGLR